MKSRRMHQSALLLALLLIVSPAPGMSAHQTLRVFFFGDSLSDSGNHFIAFREISRRPFEPVPDAPYAVGGLHFSNGPTWAEQLSWMLHSPKSGLPALLAGGEFTNYAVGRARARPGAPVFADFDLAAQTARFRGDFHGVAPPEATYAMWIGADDLNDALDALAIDRNGRHEPGHPHSGSRSGRDQHPVPVALRGAEVPRSEHSEPRADSRRPRRRSRCGSRGNVPHKRLQHRAQPSARRTGRASGHPFRAP